MNPSICNICGANYENRNGRWKCPACGAFKPEELTNEEMTLLYIADQKRRLADFDEAERAYTDIIEKYPQNPYGYWGRLLSKHGIKYECDYDGRMIPTCCAPTIESLFTDGDCLRAVDLADYETKQYFKTQAEHIERIREMWIRKASKEKPYDIFICYKDSDLGNGVERTPDSIEAQELYIHLSEQGYRVFFSRESLRDKIGEKYEPYIFNALTTAKVMIVYGKSANYITSTWLKNEWTRYQRMIQKGVKAQNSLIVAYDGFSPSELPSSLSSMQCLDASRRTYYQDLDNAIKVVLKKEEPHKATSTKKESKGSGAITCPACGGDFSSQDLLDGDSIVTCLTCGKNFFTSEIMAQHKVKQPRIKRKLTDSERRTAEERASKFKKGAFSKVILFCMVLFAALAFACFMNDGVWAGLIALGSSALFLVAYLLGIQVLKTGNFNLHIVAAILAFLLIIPYGIVGANINFGDNTDYTNTFEWQTNGLFALLPEPETNNGKIVSEIEKQIHIDLYNISPTQFDEYTKECRNHGFTYEVTKNEDVFYAKNERKYDLNIFYDDKTKVMSIYLDSYDVEASSNSSGNEDDHSSIDIDEFVSGYEKAVFSKYNSLASINGLEGTRIYIECTLESTEVLEAQDTKSILAYIKDDGGNRWLVQMHFIPAVSANHYDSIIGKPIVLKGVYSGYSQTREIPVVVLDELLVKETGITMTGMQKLLDE